MNRTTQLVSAALAPLAVAGLVLVPACSPDQSANGCKETDWTKGEVTVKRAVRVKEDHDDQAKVLTEIEAGTTLSPTRRYVCEGGPTWLMVEYREGDTGWILRNRVRPIDPTPARKS